MNVDRYSDVNKKDRKCDWAQVKRAARACVACRRESGFERLRAANASGRLSRRGLSVV